MPELTVGGTVKRLTLSSDERTAHLEHARRCIARSPFGDDQVTIDPLTLSDCTQTYRVAGRDWTAVLKTLPPASAYGSARVHRFLTNRGMALPALIWTDIAEGALLLEDVGSAYASAHDDLPQLLAIVRYLARLHDSCVIDEATAWEHFPALAAGGFPTAASRAANIVLRCADRESRLRGKVIDAAFVLAATAPPNPCLTISDVKREHFLFRDGQPLLVDLELASFWDLPAANLATLFAFPGQFARPLSSEVRRMLLVEYASACASAPRDIDALQRAVEAAEYLLRVTLSQAASLCRAQPGFMMRDRRFRESSDGAPSVEEELGPRCFARLLAVLRQAQRVRLLDAGSGTGQTLRDVSTYAPRHFLSGVDLEPGHGTPHGVAADVHAQPFADETFDAVLAVQLLQYLPDKLRALEEIYRILRRDGVAVFAMTEHFGSESAFVPPLSELAAAAPPGIIDHIGESWVHSRRVMQFAMTRCADDLRFPFALSAAVPSTPSGFPSPYFQSVYSPVSRSQTRRGF
jgi:SAM-dependent methyltransferase